MNKQEWTELDDGLLVKLYPLTPCDELMKTFSRTMTAISQRARKLGVKRRRHRGSSNLKKIGDIWFSYIIRDDGYIQISSPVLAPNYRVSEHRYIWEIHRGQIPSGHEIHHIDGNRQNNVIENLECVATSEHHSRDRKVRNSMSAYLKSIGHYDLWLESFNNGHI